MPSIVLFRKLNWIPIFNLIKMRKILLVFNTLKTSWPPDLRKLFVFVRDSHPIPTRSSMTDLKVPSVKTTQAKSKISFSGASLFNSLPSELKDIENQSIYSHKKKLKTYFIQLNYEVDHINSAASIVSILLIVNVTLNRIFFLYITIRYRGPLGRILY